MITSTARLLPRPILTLVGLGLALALRLAVAGEAGVRSASAGLVFAAALVFVAVAAGWKPVRPRPASLALGVVGAAGLIAMPAVLRLSSDAVAAAFPLDSLPIWVAVVSVVAIAEEVLLRGILFDLMEAAVGPVGAVGVTTVAFAVLHVPLYGWEALPVDLAAGVWLGGLRLLSGDVAAPAGAHVLADLAAWWLV